MTTMDRLYKKGLLGRSRSERAFLYAPRFSREDWERQRAGRLVNEFLAGPKPAHEMLLSCLIDAVGEYDPSLLHELEKRIQSKRRTLRRRKKEAD